MFVWVTALLSWVEGFRLFCVFGFFVCLFWCGTSCLVLSATNNGRLFCSGHSVVVSHVGAVWVKLTQHAPKKSVTSGQTYYHHSDAAKLRAFSVPANKPCLFPHKFSVWQQSPCGTVLTDGISSSTLSSKTCSQAFHRTAMWSRVDWSNTQWLESWFSIQVIVGCLILSHTGHKDTTVTNRLEKKKKKKKKKKTWIL